MDTRASSDGRLGGQPQTRSRAPPRPVTPTSWRAGRAQDRGGMRTLTWPRRLVVISVSARTARADDCTATRPAVDASASPPAVIGDRSAARARGARRRDVLRRRADRHQSHGEDGRAGRSCARASGCRRRRGARGRPRGLRVRRREPVRFSSVAGSRASRPCGPAGTMIADALVATSWKTARSASASPHDRGGSEQ